MSEISTQNPKLLELLQKQKKIHIDPRGVYNYILLPSNELYLHDVETDSVNEITDPEELRKVLLEIQ